MPPNKQDTIRNIPIEINRDIVNVMESENILPEEEDRVANFFIDKTIFISGCTGFLGRVLLEKLLRSCYGFKKIYLLVREKKGKTPQQRAKEMMNGELFNLVKTQRNQENILKQIDVIKGDVMLPGLGLSSEDRKKLTEEVQIIYHCAANARSRFREKDFIGKFLFEKIFRFDEPLHKAILINTRGTKFMLELARQCKELILFTHISTAYCHFKEEILYEKPYPPPLDPEDLIKLCEILDEEKFSLIEEKILGDCPNTYCLTKCLSEHLVVKTFNELPTLILRPSIIVPIWKEPLPGWTDNINGPTGLLIGAGRGVIRSMYINGDRFGDFIPVDIAVNGILLASWYYPCIDKMQQRIGHITSSKEIQITWNEILDTGRWIIENKVPFNMIAWYPGGSPKNNRFLHNICLVLFQWIPAFIGDAFIWLAGYPPILVRVQRRIMKGFVMVEYYINREWNFDNAEANKVRLHMNKIEREKYCVEKKDLDIYSYLEASIYASRRYIMKTPDDMIPAAKRQMKIMWLLDRFCKTAFLLWLAYFIYKQFLLRLFS